MEQKAEKITNIEHLKNAHITNSLIINVDGRTPLSELLSLGGQNPAISDAVPEVTGPEHTFRGCLIMMTIPEPPINEEETPSVSVNDYEVVFRDTAKRYKIHLLGISSKNLVAYIDDADMNPKRIEVESTLSMFSGYVHEVFRQLAQQNESVKFRIYCSMECGIFQADKDAVSGVMDFENAFQHLSVIHEGMSRLFCPLLRDYDERYDYETEEFKKSLQRHYRTILSDTDYLDEGIIIGTNDPEFIGGFSHAFVPVTCNEYQDTKTVILYHHMKMPGQPHTILQKVKRGIKEFL